LELNPVGPNKEGVRETALSKTVLIESVLNVVPPEVDGSIVVASENPLQDECDDVSSQVSLSPAVPRDEPSQVQQLIFDFAAGMTFEPRVELTGVKGSAACSSGRAYVGAGVLPRHSAVIADVRRAIQEEIERQGKARAAFLALGADRDFLFPRAELDDPTYVCALQTCNRADRHTNTHTPHVIADSATSAQRIAYNERIDDAHSALMQQLGSAGVWNTPFAAASHAALGWPELAHVAMQVEKFLNAQVTLVLPFAKEPWTIELNYQHARQFIPAEQIFAASADRDSSSENRVSQWHPKGSMPLSQRQVLRAINWDQVSEVCGLPRERDPLTGVILPPVGTKGLTMLAGLLGAHANGLVANRYVAFHDTDIVNPDSYDALRLTALPLVHAQQTPSLVLIGKSGAGRNNQGWTGTMNLIAADPDYSSCIRMVARQASCLVWPLSGERMAAGNHLLQIPWSTGMSIETNMNLMFSSISVDEGRHQIHQVLSGVKKLESGTVAEDREWNLMQMCRGWGEALLRFCSNRNKSPIQLSLGDIRAFNLSIGGRVVDSMHQSPEDEANSVTSSAFDFLLPSVKQLDELGAIDWDLLRQ
jgi:hypothetical protein